jgi:hypothetical protein
MSLQNPLTLKLQILNADGSIYTSTDGAAKTTLSIPSLGYIQILSSPAPSNGTYTYSLPEAITSQQDVEDALEGITTNPKTLPQLLSDSVDIYIETTGFLGSSNFNHSLIEDDFNTTGVSNLEYNLFTNQPPTNQPSTQNTASLPPSTGTVLKGNIVNSNGGKLKDVTVQITGQTIPPNTSVTTDNNGDWSLLISSSIDPTQVSISFIKEGFVTKYINNPQQTQEVPSLPNVTGSGSSL